MGDSKWKFTIRFHHYEINEPPRISYDYAEALEYAKLICKENGFDRLTVTGRDPDDPYKHGGSTYCKITDASGKYGYDLAYIRYQRTRDLAGINTVEHLCDTFDLEQLNDHIDEIYSILHSRFIFMSDEDKSVEVARKLRGIFRLGHSMAWSMEKYLDEFDDRRSYVVLD